MRESSYDSVSRVRLENRGNGLHDPIEHSGTRVSELSVGELEPGDRIMNAAKRIILEVKKTRHGKLLAYADEDAPSGARAMTDAERKAHDYIKNLIAEFDEDAVEPGVVGHVLVDDGAAEVEWCSEDARAAAGGAA